MINKLKQKKRGVLTVEEGKTYHAGNKPHNKDWASGFCSDCLLQPEEQGDFCTPPLPDELLLKRLELTHSLVLQSSKNLAVDIKDLKKRYKKTPLKYLEDLIDQLEEGEERLRIEEFGLRDIIKQVRKQIKLDLNRKIG